MSSAQQDLLKQVLTLTEAMIKDAETEEWDALLQKDIRRSEQLSTIDFDNLDSNSTIPDILSQLISLNKQLESMCVKEKDLAYISLTTIKRGKKMRQAIENLYAPINRF